MRRIGLAARLLLGLVFLATAIGKLLDNRGFAGVLATFDLLPLGPGGLLAVGLVLSLAELAAGLLLLTGRRLGVAIAAVLSVVNLVAILSALARGLPLANCGCFGVFLARPLTRTTPWEDVALLVLALLAWPRRRRYA